MEEKDYKYMVGVRCFTFNQSRYILDALNGFVMQQTNFPFVVMVVDDASTDGEQEVISKFISEQFDTADNSVAYKKETDYAHISYAQHKINKNCFIAALYLKENHYSQRKAKSPYLSEWRDNIKYEALCEGDDYWIDPLKLRKQVDFMEKNEEYVMCHTDFNLSDGNWRNHNIYIAENDNYFPYCITSGSMQVGTLTVLYRKNVYDQIPKLWLGKGWPMGDLPMWIEFAIIGKIKYLSEITANYRVLNNSASHGSIEKEIMFTNATLEVKRFYANQYGVHIHNEGFSKSYFVTIMKYAYKHQDIKYAIKYKDLAKEKKLTSWKMYVLYYATMFPLFGSVMSKLYLKQIKSI